MAQTFMTPPRADGFFMPAEFSPHDRTWMLWPERPDTWRLQAGPAQLAFAVVARTIAGFEPVTVCASASQYKRAHDLLPPEVRVVEISSNDAWMRDVGPTFVVNTGGGLRGIDWIFNAWGGQSGGLYSSWDLDQAVAQKVLEIEGLDRYQAPLVLEGGAIHVDGEFTLLTTEQCLLNPNRNPELELEEIEQYLRAYTGVTKIIWLGAGVYNDETDGHIDNLACFLRPGVVALTWTDDHNDPQYPISKDALDRLQHIKDAYYRPLEVVKLHQPEPIVITAEESAGVAVVDGTLPRKAGTRLAASYVNFYLCNGGAIVPTFGDPRDAPALATLQKYLPERQVVGVSAREILLGGGNIHCITQQQPHPAKLIRGR